MENDTGTTFFIDGGSSDVNQVGRYRIVPYLLSRGTDTLDYAIVTHTDEDHVSGLIELIEGEQITINHIILPNTNTKNEAYYEIERLAKDNDIKLIYIAAGDVLVNGRLQITTLHPPVGYQPLTNNDYSTVLSISYGKFDMLLTGDIEARGEKKLIEYLTRQEIKQSDYDVLQVAHHGSRNSTSEELLLIIRPELSLISCGRNNRYGHPHPELLDRLNDIGSEVAISYDSGAITIKTDGKRMLVEKYME
jgi:competence protein ComEC